MSLENIKTKAQTEKGFTIVELLIVVVVIAILAAITIVSYNGITTKANASAAASLAATFQKKVELYAADDDGAGAYPTTMSQLTNSAKSSKAYFVATGTVTNGIPAAATGKTTLDIKTCTTGGLTLKYWDYNGNSLPATPQIKVGDTSGTCTTALGA